jgi:hypothetical protein
MASLTIQSICHAMIFSIQPTESSPLLGFSSEPYLFKRRCWIGVMCMVATLVVIHHALSATPSPSRGKSVVLSRDLANRTTFIKPPSDIYDWPLNRSCREEYLDTSSNNMCWDKDNPCLAAEKYNCPRVVLPQLNLHATVFGFLSWYGNGTYEYIPAQKVRICQREIFRNKVEYDISKQLYPIPGVLVPCEEEGRTYPISLEGCIVDGTHGAEACTELQKYIKVIRFAVPFLLLAETMKTYLHLCWKRELSAKICHKANP